MAKKIPAHIAKLLSPHQQRHYRDLLQIRSDAEHRLVSASKYPDVVANTKETLEMVNEALARYDALGKAGQKLSKHIGDNNG